MQTAAELVSLGRVAFLLLHLGLQLSVVDSPPSLNPLARQEPEVGGAGGEEGGEEEAATMSKQYAVSKRMCGVGIIICGMLLLAVALIMGLEFPKFVYQKNLKDVCILDTNHRLYEHWVGVTMGGCGVVVLQSLGLTRAHLIAAQTPFRHLASTAGRLSLENILLREYSAGRPAFHILPSLTLLGSPNSPTGHQRAMFVCLLLLFYAMPKAPRLYRDGDMIYEMIRKKPEPTFFTDSRDL